MEGKSVVGSNGVKYEIDCFHLPRWGETWYLDGRVEKRGWCFNTGEDCVEYALLRCKAKQVNPRTAIKWNGIDPAEYIPC